MKLKVSLDVKSVQNFFIGHAEKFVLVVVGLVVLLLTYGAIAREVLPWAPEELARIAREAETSIEQANLRVDLEPSDFPGRVNKIIEPIKLDPYEFVHLWAGPLFAEGGKRGKPEVYTVQELRAAAGFGAVRMGGRAGDVQELSGRVRGQRWVAIVGLLPIEQQREAYDRVFMDATYRDLSKDEPKYAYYTVERAEVDPWSETTELEWTKLHTLSAHKVRDYWSGEGREPVESKYLAKTRIPMAFPLPPLVNRPFGPEIAHPPTIPLYASLEEEVPEEELKEPEDLEDSPDSIREMQRPRGGVYGPGRLGDPSLGGPDLGTLGGDLGADHEGGLYEDYGGGLDMGLRYGSRLVREQVSFQLFRFFDFSVEPGRYYVYRVSLWLENPNYEVPKRHVEPEELVDEKYLMTEMSEPSNLVGVPHDSRLLVISAKSSPWITTEPKGQLMAVHFDAEKGDETAEEFPVLRGQLANFPDRPVPEKKTAAGGYGGLLGGDLGGAMPMYGPDMGEERKREKKEKKKKRIAPEDVETVDYLTETLVLDISGGRDLPGRDRDLTEPANFLLLDPAGNLIVRNELDDMKEYRTYKAPEEKKRPEEGEEMYGDYGVGGMEEAFDDAFQY